MCVTYFIYSDGEVETLYEHIKDFNPIYPSECVWMVPGTVSVDD